MDNKHGRRWRRVFTEEFRVGAVRLVLDEGQTIGSVARDLDLTPSALRTRVERARADRFDTFGKAKRELFEYIEVFNNQRRWYSTIGQVSPAAFEKAQVALAA